MQCPVCGHLRYKADWTPAQWKYHTPNTYDLNYHDRCKVCLKPCPGAPCPGAGSGSDSRADLPPKPAGSQAVPQDVDKQLCVFVWLLQNFEYAQFTTFIQRWMELPRHVRKDLSYDGAIQCRGMSGERASAHRRNRRARPGRPRHRKRSSFRSWWPCAPKSRG